MATIESKNPHKDPIPADPPPYTHGPPPHTYGPPPPPPGAVTIIPAGVIIHQALGPGPTHVTCRSCNAQMVTRVDKKASMRTHIIAGLLCLFGCWPCICIPYCMDSCLSTDHYCTNCGAFVGSYLR